MKNELTRCNPFTDRLSRDIRNTLSATLESCLSQHSLAPAEQAAARFRTPDLGAPYREYINDRLHRYQQAIATIAGRIADPVHQAFVLWDLELFFEMHEVLEHAWYDAEGEYKLLLQALVRAAGAYIKLAHGYHDQASRIAAKSLSVLDRQRDVLAKYINPEHLLAALHSLPEKPPRLLR